MPTVTIIVNEAPGSMRTWNALRVAKALIAAGNKVNLFLLDNGVYGAIKAQNNLYELSEFNINEKLSTLLELGGVVYACGVCLKMKGISSRELVQGVQPSSLEELARLIEKSNRVLVF